MKKFLKLNAQLKQNMQRKILYSMIQFTYRSKTGKTTNKYTYYIKIFKKEGLGNNVEHLATNFSRALSTKY